jgi:2,5-diamino-6-(ribosylamino)-4(3H)-pyrimidinone 5'-phosphate reductase
MSETLHFPAEQAAKLEQYLPQKGSDLHLTLTFATSLDSAISLRPGVQTALSGPESKAMTHYLRSKHKAILIGVGTAIADDPGLNCRIEGSTSQPRPVIVDPRARWPLNSELKVIRLAREGKGLAPFVIVSSAAMVADQSDKDLKDWGGKYIKVPERAGGGFSWSHIMQILKSEGLDSVMVEGGGTVINSLLWEENLEYINSVILTIAPTWLGKGGVVVSPDRDRGEQGNVPAARLRDVKWCPLGEDVVLCGRPTNRICNWK